MPAHHFTTPIVPDDHAWLHGVIADLPTPFDADDRLDLATFARLCERQIRAGASAVLVGDAAGEGDVLDDHERTALIRTAAAIARGRVKVIAGAGSNATGRAIALTRLVQAAGADAAMSVVPYYNRPGAEGIAAHFRAILADTTLPLILHDAPTRCARSLADATIVDLVDASRLIGLRDDTGDVARMLRLRRPGFRLLNGDDTTALSYLLAGGDGVISAMANVTPQLSRGLYCAARRGCPRYATTIADMLMPLAAALAPDQVASMVKHALSRGGLGSALVRLPRLPLAADDRRRVDAAVEAIWARPDDALPWRMQPRAGAESKRAAV